MDGDVTVQHIDSLSFLVLKETQSESVGRGEINKLLGNWEGWRTRGI